MLSRVGLLSLIWENDRNITKWVFDLTQNGSFFEGLLPGKPEASPCISRPVDKPRPRTAKTCATQSQDKVHRGPSRELGTGVDHLRKQVTWEGTKLRFPKESEVENLADLNFGV